MHGAVRYCKLWEEADFHGAVKPQLYPKKVLPALEDASFCIGL